MWVFSEHGLRITREGFSVEYVSKLQNVERSTDILGREKDVCEIQSPSRTWLIWGTISNSIEMAK